MNRANTNAYASRMGLNPERLPRHVAIIMDGNGRWAVEQGQPRVAGHLRGADVVREIVTESSRLGLEQLTLYCFSAENWKRPPSEVDFLMGLLKSYLIEERELILRENIRFRVIGRRHPLSEDVLHEIDTSIQLSANATGLTLCLAINYGGRVEILDACERLSASNGPFTEEAFSAALDTAGMPDPDLLIRTAGEMRISNFLLWQISYAELWVTEKGWPDFTPADLHLALRDFAGRRRRFGGLDSDTEVAIRTELPS